MDSQKWSQRGKKLFLPKIEYSRLENSAESWNTAKLRFDSSNEFVVQENIENDDLEKSPSSVLSDRNGISFTKFSVLPPIQGSKASSKGRLSNRRQQLSDCVVSGEAEELYYKRKGSSLHRQTAVLTPDREPITLQKTNTDNPPLKIVGKRYSGLNNTRNNQQSMLAMDDRSHGHSGNSTSRPSTTPNASHPFVCGAKSYRTLSDSENDNTLTFSSDRIPQTDRSGARISARRLSKFRRFNSDTSSEGKPESLEDLPATNKNTNPSLLSRANLPQANLLLNPSGSEGNCRSLRPISRCHIDINMNESENINLNIIEDRKVRLEDTSEPLFDTTLSADALSSAPLIQVSTEQNSSTEERHESQNPPSIQILINSLDSAKEEGIQDERTEQPKLSVREQRRRSALCRANSKQVDDFLLVHNLRDLGLL